MTELTGELTCWPVIHVVYYTQTPHNRWQQVHKWYVSMREVSHLGVWRGQWGDSRVTHALRWRRISHRICRGRQREMFTSQSHIVPSILYVQSLIYTLTHTMLQTTILSQYKTIFVWISVWKRLACITFDDKSIARSYNQKFFLNEEHTSGTPAPIERCYIGCL